MVQLLLNASRCSHLGWFECEPSAASLLFKIMRGNPGEIPPFIYYLLKKNEQILKENTENVLYFKGFYSVEDQPYPKLLLLIICIKMCCFILIEKRPMHFFKSS